ncbi:REDY-like protein HapK [Sphingomonas hengshuiensis]|uniref:REDY-like protein HapK n=1 Tax=Sphingomonas hengshuiensis TaxID=1609977 RepID=A0A7U5CUV0_9SPHN|nr:REDY-like protein HapK [Sphingomonas hengshuiensis]AJP74059.1 REDY-like protein HapK [Sphingomonas hengshuiensis]
MTRIIVLLNLKPGKSRADYEKWARASDLPTVNGLASVERFELFEATGLLNGDSSPYDYVEIIDVADMDVFGKETKTETMARIAAEFRDWATPMFIVTRKVGGAE